jgi:uncharacterized membrane protein YccC
MFKWVMAGKADQQRTFLEKVLTSEKVKGIESPRMREACAVLCDLVDAAMSKPKSERQLLAEAARSELVRSLKEGCGYAETHYYR